jgi:hypothetical protein
LENGKSGEKNHNEGESVGRDRILMHRLKDFPPRQHSPLLDHYQSRICLPIYNEQVKTIPLTFDVEVVGMKPCSLNDILHILKELEYTLLIIPHPEEYYFIYRLHTCFLVGFIPPMFNARIFIEDFERMWKI